MKLDDDLYKIKKREIQPSLNSWGKLSARLDENEQRSVGWLYWLSGAAAVFLLGFFFFSMITTRVNKTDEQLVLEQEGKDVKEVNLNDELVLGTEDIPEIEQIKDSIEAIYDKGVVNSNQRKNDALVNPISIPQKESIEITSLASSNKDLVKENGLVKNEMKDSLPIPAKQDLWIKENTNEMVTSASLSPSQEADLLLQQALQNQVQPSMVVSQSINPALLLLETEWDIESDKISRLQNSIQQGLNILKAEAVALIEN